MEQVVYECIESLIKHGFRRFMFYNAHGGNNIVQEKLIHRVNSNTVAYATSIGVGSPLWPTDGKDYFDWHAGRFETSLDLCLFPDLVQLDKAEKPVIRFTEELEEMKLLAEEYPELIRIWDGSMFLPAESGKGTAVHEISSNGVISFSDPRDASTEYGQPYVDSIVNSAAALIKAWKMLD
jgi:creatinine amidohydrolase